MPEQEHSQTKAAPPVSHAVSGAEPPAHDLAPLAGLHAADGGAVAGGAVLGEDVAPVAADTMGNAATSAMVREWVQGLHGGTTDDAVLRGEKKPWETEHRFEIRDDIDESASLSRRKTTTLDSGRTLETGGTTTGGFSSRDGVRTGSLGGKGDFTVRGSEALEGDGIVGGEVQRSVTGKGGLEVERSSRKGDDGQRHVTRRVQGDVGLGGEVVSGRQLEDGTVVESRHAHEGSFGWDTTREDGKVTDRSLSAGASTAWGRSSSQVDDAGNEVIRTVGVDARGQGSRTGLGDQARTSGDGSVTLSGGVQRIEGDADRRVTTDLSGDVGLKGGVQHGPGADGSRGIQDAGGQVSIGGGYGRTVEERADDGSRTKTELGVKGSTYGGVAGLGDAQRHQGGVDAELSAARTHIARGEDGRTVTTRVGGAVGGAVDGDRARTGADDAVMAKGKASVDASRKVAWTDDADVRQSRGVSVGVEGTATGARSRDGEDRSTSAGQGGKLTLGGSADRSWDTDDGVTRTQGVQGTVALDGKRDRGADGAVKREAGVTVGGVLSDATEWTEEDGTRREDARSLDAEVGVRRRGGRNEQSAEVGASRVQETSEDIDGGTRSTQVKDRVALSGTRRAAASPDEKAELGARLGASRGTKVRTERTDDLGRHSITDESKLDGAGTWSRDAGFGVSAGYGADHEQRTTTEDGRTIRTSASHDSEARLSRKKGLELSHDRRHLSREEVEKLDDQTTLTTRAGDVKASASAGVRREDGDWRYTAGASASAVAYGQDLRWDDGEGTKISAGYRVGAAEADAKAEAVVTEDQLKVTGNAGAKATLVDGNARFEIPAFDWNLLGEDVQVKLTAGVDAGVLAEAAGNVELNLSKGDELALDIAGGGKAFAGATSGVEVGGRVDWKRQPDYTDLLIDFMDDVPGIGWALDDIPRDIYQQAALALVGRGTSQLVAARAGVLGSAGLGAEANFSGGLKGGRIRLSGRMNAALGVGGGLKTSVDLDAVDGVRFAGVVGLRGIEWIKDEIAGVDEWLDQAIDDMQERIDAWLEAEKAEGGIDGWFAGAVDWMGDDLLDLW